MLSFCFTEKFLAREYTKPEHNIKMNKNLKNIEMKMFIMYNDIIK